MNQNNTSVSTIGSVGTIEIQALLRGWRTMAITTATAMLIGAAFLITIPPRQEVAAKLIVETRSTALNGKSSGAREKEFLPTQAEVIASPAVIASAIGRLDPALSEAEVAAEVRRIAGQLKIDPLAGTDILLVRYTDVTAQRAAEIVNAVIAGYRENLAAAEQQQRHEVLITLTSQHAELQSTLSAMQVEYEQLKRMHADTAGTDSETSARILAGLEESLAETRSRRLLLERAEERLGRRQTTLLARANPHAVVTADSPPETAEELTTSSDELAPVLQDLAALSHETWTGIQNPAAIEARIRDARTRVSELTVVLGPKHPELLAVRSSVRQYEQELERLVQTAPAVMQLALDGMRMQETALQQRYKSHLRLAHETEMLRLKESQKLAEIDRAKQSCETLHTQLQQYQLADQRPTGGQAAISVAVLEPPVPAERSFAANPLIVMGIAGLLGLLFGISLLVVLPQVKSLLTNLPQVSIPLPAERSRIQELHS